MASHLQGREYVLLRLRCEVNVPPWSTARRGDGRQPKAQGWGVLGWGEGGVDIGHTPPPHPPFPRVLAACVGTRQMHGVGVGICERFWGRLETFITVTRPSSCSSGGWLTVCGLVAYYAAAGWRGGSHHWFVCCPWARYSTVVSGTPGDETASVPGAG